MQARYKVRSALGCRDVDLMARLNRAVAWQGVSVSAGKKKKNNKSLCHRETERGKSIFEAD